MESDQIAALIEGSIQALGGTLEAVGQGIDNPYLEGAGRAGRDAAGISRSVRGAGGARDLSGERPGRTLTDDERAALLEPDELIEGAIEADGQDQAPGAYEQMLLDQAEADGMFGGRISDSASEQGPLSPDEMTGAAGWGDAVDPGPLTDTDMGSVDAGETGDDEDPPAPAGATPNPYKYW